ncbi:MAG: hypothetical protein ACRDJC_02090 [Thermomicrobiales bacterium]
MHPHTQAEANGRPAAQLVDLERIGIDPAAPDGAQRAIQDRGPSQAPEETHPEETAPTRERAPFDWQQFRWILSHGMLP